MAGAVGGGRHYRAAEFRKQWVESFDAPGQEEWWTGYLARNARPPDKAK
jgi:hypothetical protein